MAIVWQFCQKWKLTQIHRIAALEGCSEIISFLLLKVCSVDRQQHITRKLVRNTSSLTYWIGTFIFISSQMTPLYIKAWETPLQFSVWLSIKIILGDFYKYQCKALPFRVSDSVGPGKGQAGHRCWGCCCFLMFQVIPNGIANPWLRPFF